MRVMIDPNELGAVARTLEQCAVEVAEIGSQLSGCVACPMPPAVAADVGALVAQSDALLDQIGVVFTDQAAGLLGRAIIAVLDSLTAASGVAAPLALGVVGGSSLSGMTISTSDGSPAAGLYEMGGVVGGSSLSGITITNLDGSPAVGLSRMGSVVGGNWSPDQGTDYLRPLNDVPNFVGRSQATPRSMSTQTFINNILNQPVNNLAINRIAYNQMASGMNQMDRTPPEPYNWHR